MFVCLFLFFISEEIAILISICLSVCNFACAALLLNELVRKFLFRRFPGISDGQEYRN